MAYSRLRILNNCALSSQISSREMRCDMISVTVLMNALARRPTKSSKFKTKTRENAKILSRKPFQSSIEKTSCMNLLLPPFSWISSVSRIGDCVRAEIRYGVTFFHMLLLLLSFQLAVKESYYCISLLLLR